MGKHFTKIRKKTRLAAIITSIIIGVGAGAIAFSALIIATKLLSVEAQIWSYIICGATVPIAFIVAFLVCKPSDKRLAKRLDEEHSLDEKVKTMVEFRNSNDAFAKLQREDADEKLGTIKVKFLRKNQIIAILIVAAISIGTLTGAAFVPQKEVSGPQEDPISDFDKQLIIAQISELIATVDKSLMTEEHKITSKVRLEELLEFVKTHDYMSEMKIEAIDVVIAINTSLGGVNTAPVVGELLAESKTELLALFGDELVKMSGSKTKKHLDDLKASLGSLPPDDADFVADEISAAVNTSGIDKNNLLVSKLVTLAAALENYSNSMIELDAAFGNIPFELSNEVMIQNINKMTTQTVIATLCNIFGISPDDLAAVEGGDNVDVLPPEAQVPDDDDDDDEDDKNQDVSAGGLGTGDRVYASNDIIYDPYSNTYVTYGELLDEYNARATAKMIDGIIPPDFAEFIEDYFKNLSEYKPSEA